MNLKDEVYSELAYEVFGNIEMELFDRLKKNEEIHPSKYYQLQRKIERNGVPKEFAKQYVKAQVYDMIRQIAEQEAVG